MEPDSFFSFLTPSLPASAAAALGKFSAFTEGPASGRVVTILFLPGCPHCFSLWQALTVLRQTNPAAARLRYRWVPMAITTAQATILAPYWQGPRDSKALASLMRQDNASSISSSVPVSQLQEILKATRPALLWLRRSGAQVAPALVGPDPRGGLEMHLGDATSVQLLRWLGLKEAPPHAAS